jgi:hypothetical protein
VFEESEESEEGRDEEDEEEDDDIGEKTARNPILSWFFQKQAGERWMSEGHGGGGGSIMYDSCMRWKETVIPRYELVSLTCRRTIVSCGSRV